ncbi:hypothetical protein B0T16DRAFT_444342 [Cercophora newfieldiana]|uniref:Rhamnogalacturonase A/B/Epimerase-like pectate lyase domain-containing protein n=1 Tax=Cercophora newfieldiana TaxID=92897 RepID=A0AA39Y937_9PEZI|nr:hypothetical protein B0T16DRAFT_444342 [Cercophora newfieldiana]
MGSTAEQQSSTSSVPETVTKDAPPPPPYSQLPAAATPKKSWIGQVLSRLGSRQQQPPPKAPEPAPASALEELPKRPMKKCARCNRIFLFPIRDTDRTDLRICGRYHPYRRRDINSIVAENKAIKKCWFPEGAWVRECCLLVNEKLESEKDKKHPQFYGCMNSKEQHVPKDSTSVEMTPVDTAVVALFGTFRAEEISLPRPIKQLHREPVRARLAAFEELPVGDDELGTTEERTQGQSVTSLFHDIYSRSGRPNHYDTEDGDLPVPPLELRYFEYFLRRHLHARIKADAFHPDEYKRNFEKYFACTRDTTPGIPIGLQIQVHGGTIEKVKFNLFSIAITNVPTVVKYDNGQTLLAGTSGSQTIAARGVGKRYDADNGESSGVWQSGAPYAKVPKISPSLLKSPGNQLSGCFERSKPQYETVPASNFINTKSAPYNAAGNGAADDTVVLNSALAASASSGKILWIPAGVYLVTDTVLVPKGAKVVGQSWSQIMGSGTKFSNINSPYPVVKVGNVGDVGTVEIQGLLFTWNIYESSPGAAAMWDTHVRVGGAKGTNLQVENCPKLTGATQIDIYLGRGESKGPVWLGTASEHCILYQYQTYNAQNIFMGMIQTESPYYQVTPKAPTPFPVSTVFPEDPKFGLSSDPASRRCAVSWAVRILNSANIYIYGAGLYSWFQQYPLITKASVEMMSPRGGVGKDNKINFCDIVMAWMGSASNSGGAGSGGIIPRSPASATVIPFPATTVIPTQTFTVAGAVVSQVDNTPSDGNQNVLPGPGAALCLKCDLFRLITSTYCGVGGSVSNPIVIGAGTAIPRPLILPRGYKPNQPVKDDRGTWYLPNNPLPSDIVVPIGFIFPIPFIIPRGLPLSDLWSDDGQNDDTNGTLYLPPGFWAGDRKVSCYYPCTLVFPPLTTTTTWDPPSVTVTTSGRTTTTDPPPYTTEWISISKTTIASDSGSPETRVVQPSPAPKPLCFTLDLIIIKIQLCPPELKPFPPPVPSITIFPPPPGQRPEQDNKPTPEQQQSEEIEDEEDYGVCLLVDVLDDEDYWDSSDSDNTYPGAGADNQPDGTVTVIAPPPKPATPTPNVPIKYRETTRCYFTGLMGYRDTWRAHGQQFCDQFAGTELDGMPGADMAKDAHRKWSYNWDSTGFTWTFASVDALPGCSDEGREKRWLV